MKPNFYVYDLVMFRNKETKSIILETIHTITSYKTELFNSFHINRTNTFTFNDKFEVLIETSNGIIPYIIVDDRIEVVGVWRFNNQTKNYEVIYYEG